MAKQFLSGLNGEEVDQDHNAAKNLSYWSELNASTGLVEASAPTRHPGCHRWQYRPRIGRWDDPLAKDPQ